MWTTQQLPDLTGKTILVTGANTGIGSTRQQRPRPAAASFTARTRTAATGANPAEVTIAPHALDETAARELWQLAEQATGLVFPG